MDRIMEVASKHKLAVIEDTCHVWGSNYRGKALGSIGEAAFYSYDPGKPFIIGMGGAATSNSARLTSNIGIFYKDFGRPEFLDTAKLHVQYFAYRLTRHPRLFWRVRDLYRFLAREGVAIATWTRDSLEGTLGPDYEKGLAPSLRRRLDTMMYRGNSVIARHKRLFDFYDRSLRQMGFSGLNIPYDCDPVLICYPIQVTSKAGLLEDARRARVELGDWFSSPVHPLTEPEWKLVAYTKGSCPIAERVSKQIITLPCHAGVTQKEAERTIAFLAKVQKRGMLSEAQVSERTGPEIDWTPVESQLANGRNQ
jgi:dTDP-4-amino-4,6-dideoxygalactose transaminase